MKSHTAKRRSANSPKRVLLCCIFSCLVFILMPASVHAGCHSPELGASDGEYFSGFQPGTLPKWTWWTVGPLKRSYVGGQFDYFQVPLTDGPCDHPNCRSSTPSESVSMPANIGGTRILPLGGDSRSAFYFVEHAAFRLHATDDCQWTNPPLAALLRPPRS